jgi:protein-histidine N-methyltransferase
MIGKKQQTKMDTFISWLKKNGAKFPHLYVEKYKKNERGVKTKKTLEPNKNIIRIPKKIIIYSEMGKQTDLGMQLQKHDENVSNPDIIYLLLFIVKNLDDENGFYYPYYQTLPKDLSHLPVFWRETDLKHLKGSYIREVIRERKKGFMKNYKILCRACENFSKICSVKKFMWTRSIIGSRNFGIFVDNIKQSAMVPFADMLNHSASVNTKWYYKKNAFLLDSTKSIKVGGEITDTYGIKCNSKYLLYYGFTLHDNTKYRNRVQIKISQQSNRGVLYKKKNKLIQDAFTCSIDGDFGDGEFSSLMRFLRIANSNTAEFTDISSHVNITRTPFNRRNEIATLMHLASYVEKRLKAYKKTIAASEKEITKHLPYSNAAFAIKLVIGEKKILKSILMFCETSLDVLLFHRRISPRKLKNNMKGYILLLNQLK